jgi:hypothetical protein
VFLLSGLVGGILDVLVPSKAKPIGEVELAEIQAARVKSETELAELNRKRRIVAEDLSVFNQKIKDVKERVNELDTVESSVPGAKLKLKANRAYIGQQLSEIEADLKIKEDEDLETLEEEIRDSKKEIALYKTSEQIISTLSAYSSTLTKLLLPTLILFSLTVFRRLIRFRNEVPVTPADAASTIYLYLATAALFWVSVVGQCLNEIVKRLTNDFPNLNESVLFAAVLSGILVTLASVGMWRLHKLVTTLNTSFTTGLSSRRICWTFAISGVLYYVSALIIFLGVCGGAFGMLYWIHLREA